MSAENKKTYCLLACCLAGFILLSVLVTDGRIVPFDDFFANAVQSEKSDLLTRLAEVIARIASPKVFILIAVTLSGAGLLYAVFLKRLSFARVAPPFLLFAGVNVMTGVANQILKNIFQRPRPLPEVTGYSFPSGHSMLGFAFCMTAAYLISRKGKTKNEKRVAAACGIFGTLLIGTSRIYLNVHYPSDVIAGFCVSAFIWLAGVKIFEKKSKEMFLTRRSEE